MSSWPFTSAFHCSFGLKSEAPGNTWISRPDVRGLRLARDDLHHLVAHVALAAGKLVRGAQRHVGRAVPRCQQTAASAAATAAFIRMDLHDLSPRLCCRRTLVAGASSFDATVSAVRPRGAAPFALRPLPRRGSSIAASTPPFLCGTPASSRPISTPASVPIEREVVEVAQVADAEDLARELRQAPARATCRSARARRARKRSASWPGGHHHRGERRAVFVGVLAEDLEAPGAHRAARGFRVAVVAREDVREAFFLEHRDRLAQAVEQVGGRRVGKEAVGVRRRSSRSSPRTSAAASPTCSPRAPSREIALNDRPGGSMRPFCEPPTVTSTPHSSWR